MPTVNLPPSELKTYEQFAACMQEKEWQRNMNGAIAVLLDLLQNHGAQLVGHDLTVATWWLAYMDNPDTFKLTTPSTCMSTS